MGQAPKPGEMAGHAGREPADDPGQQTTPDGEAASSMPAANGEVADMPASVGGYRVEAEIGHGGMGVVYRVLDAQLNRALAVKVLLAAHQDNAELRQRFLEEAQIMGQLQHPGVPAIHGLGSLEDGRPFLAMKQVKGRTLSALLKEKVPADLPRYLAIFAQICQTIAYAHSRGIIHRDLKPANVMVGAFGEVQVMDWGLAKLVVAGGSAAAPAETQHQGTSTVFVLRAADSDQTAAGTVLGTPAYMPPEQARGEVETLDERSDVFGLGAILCELLTGRPPFAGASKVDSHRKAMRGALDEAMARLDTCGAHAELVRLAKQCLAAEKNDRPRDAGVVAAAMDRYEAGVQLRLRQAEIDQASAQVKALEERKRRKVSRALAGVAMLLVLAVAGVSVWYVRDQAARDLRREQLDTELANQIVEVDRLQQHLQAKLADPLGASRLLSDIGAWQSDVQRLRAAWQQADVTCKAGRDLLAATRAARVSEMDQQIAVAEREFAWAQKLDQVRQDASMSADGRINSKRAVDRYAQLFPEMGFDVIAREAGELAEPVRRSSLRFVAVAALDYWAGALPSKSELAPRLVRVAAHADADPWRDQVRDTNIWSDQAKLQELADSAPLETNPQTIILLARHIKQPADRMALLRRALVHHPKEYWLYFELGQLVKDPAERAGCFRAALALRPHSIAAHNNLGNALAAVKDYDAAIRHFKKALEIDANYPHGYCNLGSALYDQRDYDGAIRNYQKAIAIDPTFAEAHSNLGIALYATKKVEEGIRSIEKAIEINPSYAAAYMALGNILHAQRKLDAAIEQYKQALVVAPQQATAHAQIGLCLLDKNDADGAIVACTNALDLNSRLVPAHVSLGTALFQKRDYDGALLHFTLAIEYEPGLATAQHGLGAALSGKNDPGGAVRAFKKAIALLPNYGLAHQNLVVALRDQGRFSDVVKHLPAAVQLASPTTKPLLIQLGKDCEKWAALDQRLPALLGGEAQPADAAEQVELAYLCGHYKKLNFAAVQFYAAAFAADPKLGTYRNRYNAACYAALALAGKGNDAARLDEGRVAMLRQLTLDWLQAALAECQQQRQGNSAQVAEARTRMAHWQTDTDLIAVRDVNQLARLPETQYREWQQFWTDVNALRH